MVISSLFEICKFLRAAGYWENESVAREATPTNMTRNRMGKTENNSDVQKRHLCQG